MLPLGRSFSPFGLIFRLTFEIFRGGGWRRRADLYGCADGGSFVVRWKLLNSGWDTGGLLR